MDTPERLAALEPLWGTWRILEFIGEGSFGKVYKIYREEFGTRYIAALKWISLPQNTNDIDRLHSEQMTFADIRSYYGDMIRSLNSEIRLMCELGGNSHIVNYADHMICERKDQIGWDILIRMEYLTPLDKKMQSGLLSENEVIRLGIHICNALSVCAKHKIIHRDVKPANIFLSDDGNYKLGDFGVARTIERTIDHMSRKGTPLYMSPEVYFNQEANFTSDLYALGLVLYQLLNTNRMPFFPLSGTLTFELREKALSRRLKGEPLLPPVNGSAELKSIVLKACAYKRTDRYKTAEEMQDDLERLSRIPDTLHPRKWRKPVLIGSCALACLVAGAYLLIDYTGINNFIIRDKDAQLPVRTEASSPSSTATVAEMALDVQGIWKTNAAGETITLVLYSDGTAVYEGYLQDTGSRQQGSYMVQGNQITLSVGQQSMQGQYDPQTHLLQLNFDGTDFIFMRADAFARLNATPEPESETERILKPTSVPTPEPTSVPTPEPAPEAASVPTPEPTPEPESIPALESVLELEPALLPKGLGTWKIDLGGSIIQVLLSEDGTATMMGIQSNKAATLQEGTYTFQDNVLTLSVGTEVFSGWYD